MIPKFTGTFSSIYPSAPKSSAAILISSIEDGVKFLVRVPSKQSIVFSSQKSFYSQPNLVIRFSLCLFCIPGCKQKQGSQVHLFKVLTMVKRPSQAVNALRAWVYIYTLLLSYFRVLSLWFIDLTVATCYIQYIFLSFMLIVSRGNGPTRKYWPPTITRRAKH